MKAEKRHRKSYRTPKTVQEESWCRAVAGEKAEEMASGLQASPRRITCAEAEATDQPRQAAGRGGAGPRCLWERLCGQLGQPVSRQQWQVADVPSTAPMTSHAPLPARRRALPWQSSDALCKGDIEIHRFVQKRQWERMTQERSRTLILENRPDPLEGRENWASPERPA